MHMRTSVYYLSHIGSVSEGIIMCQERFCVERYFFAFDAGVRGSYPMYMFGVVNLWREKTCENSARKCLTMTHKVCEDTSMMRFIQKHGLLDGDFVLPIVALTLLLTMRGMI